MSAVPLDIEVASAVCHQPWGCRQIPSTGLERKNSVRKAGECYKPRGEKSGKCCADALRCGWVYCLVVRVCGLEYGGCEFEYRSLHLRPETKLCEEKEVMLRAKNIASNPCYKR